MYTILRSIIISGKDSVSMLTHKVDMAWADGRITDDQKTELDKLIFEYKNPEMEAPDLAELYKRLEEKVNDLETRITALEEGESPVDPSKTIPAWEPWDGFSIQYQYGDVVTHGNKYWINVLSGMQNTWEPGTVDERYWKEISKTIAEKVINKEITAEEAKASTLE